LLEKLEQPFHPPCRPLLPGLLLAAAWAVPTWIAQENRAKVLSIGDRRSVIRDPAL